MNTTVRKHTEMHEAPMGVSVVAINTVKLCKRESKKVKRRNTGGYMDIDLTNK